MTEMKKTSDRAGMGRAQEFNFKQVHFEMPVISIQGQVPIRQLNM